MSTATRKPRVFISRTTAGLAALAERVAEILRQRGIEPIIQTGFYPSTHDVKGMLAEHLQQCDAVICLIGTAYGSGPHDPITKAEQPVHGLKDPRTKDRFFSYTQLELLIARDLGRPIYTFFIQGDELPAAFTPEPPELVQRQQTFITEFAKDGRNTYGTFSQWDQPADPARGLKQAIEAIQFEITVLAGKPTNLPYTSLGTLFKGRDEFLAELRQHLTAEGPVVIKGKRTIHGMGGVGKTRAAIEYAWKHADDYRALLFISADTPEALHRNLAALCGPLVLNLPEQNEKEQALQVEAALRWLKLHPGWFLIIDNVDTDEAAEEIKALLAKLATGHVLITSRISDWTGQVKSLDLDVLSDAASIAFLDERTEERRPKKDDDREQVAALVALLDCLALALEQAGAHISTSVISYADYIDLWKSHRPDALDWHDEEQMKYPKSLAITYETSVAQLHQQAKELLRMFSWFAADPIPRGVLSCLDTSVEAGKYLRDIMHFSLATFTANGMSFSIHRINQEITRQQQRDVKPQALIAALHCLEAALPFEIDDIRTWPIAIPIIPHAIASATFGLSRCIPTPSAPLLSQAALLLNTQADYRSAEIHCRRVLVVAEESNESEALATCLNNLADVLRNTGRMAEAELVARRAIKVWESIGMIDDARMANTFNNLGLILIAKDRFSEAENWIRKALAMWEMRPDDPNGNLSRGLSNLGYLLHATNRNSEAESNLREAISISEARFGTEHPNTSMALNNLAEVLRHTNRHNEAEQILRRVITIEAASFGDNHPNVACNLNNLGELLVEKNRITEAEPLLRRALELYELNYGPEHSSLSLPLNNLSLLKRCNGDYLEAEVLLRKALEINEKNFGPHHSNVALTLTNLSTLLQITNRLSEAEIVSRRALSIFESIFGLTHPKVALALNNLAQTLKWTDRPEEAESLIRRSLEIAEATVGGNHPNTALLLNNLAALLASTSREEAAEPLMRRALAIYEQSFGEDHPDVALSLNNLAHKLFTEKRQTEAEDLWHRALSLIERNGGDTHSYAAPIMNNVAEAMRKTSRFVEAEQLVKRAISINETNLGSVHPSVAVCLNNLCLVLKATERPEEAEPLMRRAINILLKSTETTGCLHASLKPVIGNYCELLAELGDTEADAKNRFHSIFNPYGIVF